MEKKIAVLRGDGIGPEVVNESIKVLERVAQKFGHTFHYYDIIGGVAVTANTDPAIKAVPISPQLMVRIMGLWFLTVPAYPFPGDRHQNFFPVWSAPFY